MSVLDVALAASGVLAVAVGALSGRLRSLPVSEPLLALLLGVLLGPAVTGVLPVGTFADGPELFHEVSRLLLALSVMAVALRYPSAEVRATAAPALLLVAVVMPAMALLTAGVAAVVLGVGLPVALLLGAALSPTDPVLAASTVTGGPAESTLPGRLRRMLSLESGANDGLALPLVLVAVAAAGTATWSDAVLESAWQVVGAVVVGVLAGALCGRAVRTGEEHGAAEPGPILLLSLALALGTLGLAALARTDGVLAVFVAGLAFNRVASGDRGVDVQVDEAVNRFLVLPLFLLLGAALPWQAWADLSWRGPLLVVGVLLLRRLPAVLALRRPLRLTWPEASYLAWFGPVGVSALFYLTLEAERLDLDPVVLAAGSLVVVGSTLVHGVTSGPGVRAYGRAAARRRPAPPTSPPPDRG